MSLLQFLRATQAVRLIVSEHEQVSDRRRGFGAARHRASTRRLGTRCTWRRSRQTRAFVEMSRTSDRGSDAAPRRFEEPDGSTEAAARGDRAAGRATSAAMPAMEFHGRVHDWIVDIRQARERGDTVLFVADSPGRAERIVEILKEYEIVALPAELAEDAHAAAVLVTVGALSRGFRLADAGLQLYAETDVFDEERRGPGSAAIWRARSSRTCAI